MLDRTNVAVVGATGVIGAELLSTLFDRGVPSEKITALATERSNGEELEYGDDSLEVEQFEPGAFRGVGVAFIATPPDVARTLALDAQAAGAWVIDLSPLRHGDADVPLVLPPINGEVLASSFKGRIVTVPAPATVALALTLEPLRQRFGLEQIQATALIGASSLGQRGIQELEKQTADLLSGRELDPVVFPHRIAFNVVPQVGPIEPATGLSSDEREWRAEWQRLFAGRGVMPPLAITAFQIPTFFGHVFNLAVKLSRATDAQAVREVLKGAEHVKVLDTPEERVYPMPMLVTADPTVHVGRVRVLAEAPEWVHLVVTIDNAGRGAAVTAVECAERLLSRA